MPPEEIDEAEEAESQAIRVPEQKKRKHKNILMKKEKSESDQIWAQAEEMKEA